MDETTAASPAVERICPNCKHFYETGKTEWEDARECEDCIRRGGVYDNWHERPAVSG